MDKFTAFWCFRLAALSRKISRTYNTLCSQYGITATQSFVLFDLLDNEGSNVKDIAFRIQLDSPAVTGVIDRLFKEGLVQRAEDPSDRRSLQIFLTPRGRQLAEELLPVGREFNNNTQAGYNQDEIEIFENYLKRLEQKF
ncbi:MAG: MarR family transcriptional regulator [Syntrophomonas sp.]|nr:MarR family transcriptional regulator [Syntrophomonas sp.]